MLIDNNYLTGRRIMNRSDPQFSMRIAVAWGMAGALIGVVLVYWGFSLLILPLCLMGGAISGWLWAKIMWHSLVKYSLSKSPGASDADKSQR